MTSRLIRKSGIEKLWKTSCEIMVSWTGLAHGDVQGVDLMLTARMLGLPHPLLADDVDVHRVRGRGVDAEVEQRTPNERDQEDGERDDRPGGFEQGGALDLGGDRVLRPAVADGEAEDQRADQSKAGEGHTQQKEVKTVRPGRNRRRLTREER